jgi:hypothetical protein
MQTAPPSASGGRGGFCASSRRTDRAPADRNSLPRIRQNGSRGVSRENRSSLLTPMTLREANCPQGRLKPRQQLQKASQTPRGFTRNRNSGRSSPAIRFSRGLPARARGCRRAPNQPAKQASCFCCCAFRRPVRGIRSAPPQAGGVVRLRIPREPWFFRTQDNNDVSLRSSPLSLSPVRSPQPARAAGPTSAARPSRARVRGGDGGGRIDGRSVGRGIHRRE